MSSLHRDKTLALAAVFQAAGLANELARRGQAMQQHIGHGRCHARVVAGLEAAQPGHAKPSCHHTPFKATTHPSAQAFDAAPCNACSATQARPQLSP